MDDDGSHEELHGARMLPQHGEGKRVFAQDDLRRLAERDTDTERALAAAQARRDALQRALGQGSTASLRQHELRLRFQQQLPYRRPLGCKFPVMGTRAAGGYVGMSES